MRPVLRSLCSHVCEKRKRKLADKHELARTWCPEDESRGGLGVDVVLDDKRIRHGLVQHHVYQCISDVMSVCGE